MTREDFVERTVEASAVNCQRRDACDLERAGGLIGRCICRKVAESIADDAELAGAEWGSGAAGPI